MLPDGIFLSIIVHNIFYILFFVILYHSYDFKEDQIHIWA